MPLTDEVREAFGPGGFLSEAAEQFVPRAGQTEMALAVARTIETGGVLVAEAGTGVGKTFSYLVPALLSGERVLLSTATKTLQDQLFGRDLPRLVQALGLPVRTALLKGRGSYLCLHRMEAARREGMPGGDAGALRALAKIEVWSQATRTGDLAELPGLDERSPVLPFVTSNRENCLGAQCPRLRACHVNTARRDALAADVAVINHHLFFADLAVRESGMAELLPATRIAIFDEAHQLNETGVQFLGRQLSTLQLLDFARDLLAAGLQLARGLADWPTRAGAVEHAARELRMSAGRSFAGTKLRWQHRAPEGIDPAEWDAALQQVHDHCEAAREALDTVSEIAPDFVRLHERAQLLAQRTARFLEPCDPAAVRWVDVGNHLRLVESPLDIAEAVRTRMLRRPPEEEPGAPADPVLEDVAVAAADTPSRRPRAADEEAGADPHTGSEGPSPGPGPSAEAAERPRAWIFTSATLGNDPRLRWFTERCGLEDAEVLRVESPFDYARQAALYVPSGMPKPSDAAHAPAVAALSMDAAGRLGGRTLVLTTTLRALRTIGDAFRQRFGSHGAVEVLVQGDWPKRRLMERFREGDRQGRGCVLVASASFWEGFDVPGEALQLVVIDKLPFPPPNDPLVEARSHRLERAGRSPFNDYFVPEAAVALKQGAGRLIRRESDRGILVVCDSRLTTMGYGRRLLAGLPPMRMLESAAEFDQALGELLEPAAAG
ncbi:MAG: ATP-dependent DNA helicase [Xylophilus ampelinus]